MNFILLNVLNSNLSDMILFEGTILADGATINGNGIVTYPVPHKEGYTTIALNASVTGTGNINIVGIWEYVADLIIFRNLTSSTITAGKLFVVAVFLKDN